jgi:oligopeptide transport system substrate-binding protein
MPFAKPSRRITLLTRLIPGFFVVCFFSGCTELQRPDPNPYLAETQPPAAQEFRWSNGAMPSSLDPARTSAAPEIDVVRAMYEGLTVLDPNTLQAMPGVAEKWDVSPDGLEWTFHLRSDADWSNGRAVTSADFVRSWQRVYEMGEAAAHENLLQNFAVGSESKKEAKESEPEDFEQEPHENDLDANAAAETSPTPSLVVEKQKMRLDVSAPDETTLVVKLRQPDSEFPKLVAHPIFMPVYGASKAATKAKLDAHTVSNGPFHVTEITDDNIVLERSDNYWNRDAVKIEKLRFVPVAKTDDALDAYRSGKIDAVTNTDISPLAQKLFSTTADFRKSAFAALNFYEINVKKAPFNDRRVREALAIAIEREQLVAGDGETMLQPAFTFLPFVQGQGKALVQDKDRARDLLEQAGFPGGRGFAPIKLTINRNETQIRMARAVAKMWKENLNVEAVLDIRENDELSTIRSAGDFDLIRRGVVFPVPDELACMWAIHGEDVQSPLSETGTTHPATQSNSNNSVANASAANARPSSEPAVRPILDEAEALYQLHAIPLYFPTSFALVKPYVKNFELNSFDAPFLNATEIDTAWQPVAR